MMNSQRLQGRPSPPLTRTLSRLRERGRMSRLTPAGTSPPSSSAFSRLREKVAVRPDEGPQPTWSRQCRV